MGLTTYFNATCKRGYVRGIIAIAEAIYGTPLIVLGEDYKPLNVFSHEDFKKVYPQNDNETKSFYVNSMLSNEDGNISSFSFTVKNHILTEEEKNDRCAAGYDITIFDHIKASPNEENLKHFNPLIGVCNLYGYSEYKIYSEYDENFSKGEEFGSPDRGRLWAVQDNEKYRDIKNGIALFILNETNGSLGDDVVNAIKEGNKNFRRFVGKEQTRMRKSTHYTKSEIKFYGYSLVSYQARLMFIAYEIAKIKDKNLSYQDFISKLVASGVNIKKSDDRIEKILTA